MKIWCAIVFLILSPSIARDMTYFIRGMGDAEKESIQWSLDQWEAASNGRIRFIESTGQSPHITFSYGVMPNSAVEAWCQKKDGRFYITFDRLSKWATTSLQRELTMLPNMRTMSLHEIGHVLIGMGHSMDPRSIMYPSPAEAKIDATSASLIK